MEKLVQQILAYISTIPRPKEWVLKLLSLLFALFLWYFVVGEDKVDMNVSIPVEIVNLPRELVIANQFKKQLEVTVSGQRSLIRGLANQHITRSVDLSSAHPGTEVIHNEPDSIDFPWGISVLRVQPSNFTLLIDRLSQKTLPVKPVIKGTLPKGFELIATIPDPREISIAGPENILAGEKFLKTRPIDISDQTESLTKQIPLDLKPDLTDLLGEPVVAVSLTIKEKIVERQISDIPIVLKGLNNSKYRLQPDTVNIRVQMPYSLAQKWKDSPDAFQAVVDPRGLTSGSQPLKVEILFTDQATSIKKGLKVLSRSPETVTLEINAVNKLKTRH